jgi:hypothetical protein
MPAPRWLKLCGTGTQLCAHCVGCFVLWAGWLALIVALVIQGFIAFARELPVPEFALRRIEQRLADAGLRATFGAATFDPGGHLLLRDVRLSLGPVREPVVTAESVYLELDPWALLLRDVQIETVELSGAEFRVPALLSPSGQAEAVVSGVDATIKPAERARGLEISHLTARVGPLHVHARGHLPARPKTETTPSPEQWLAQAAQLYPRLSRDLAGRIAQLPTMEEARLALELSAEADGTSVWRSAFTAVAITIEASTGQPLAGITARDLDTELILRRRAGEQPSLAFTCNIRADAVHDLARGDLRGLHARIAGSADPGAASYQVHELLLAADEAISREVTLHMPRLELDVARWPEVSGGITAVFSGAPWAVRAAGDPRARTGSIAFEGRLTPELVAFVSERARRDLGALLTCERPPTLAGTAAFESGRIQNARVQVDAGPVIAGRVPLDAASAVLQWNGTALVAEDLRLAVGASEARGRYEMDTETRDFRFLLDGRLQPEAINGWFREWWPRFWSRFEFGATPPAASVDVQGRWGAPLNTTVFVAADGAPARLQGAHFDRIRTRLFVRPGFTDVVEFIGDRDARQARGTFTRTADLTSGDWTKLTFDVEGDTDLEPAPALFGQLGASIIEPFNFTTPPRLHVTGELERADEDTQPTSDVRITGSSSGDWTFYRFPLRDMSFRAHLRNDVLLVDEIDVSFAGGRGTGRAELRGLDTERRLAFDLALNNARLGEGIRTLETWSAERKGEQPPPVSRFQQRVAAGRLDLALSAEGHYDDPYSLQGAGNAVISGAELGEIHMLGILSSLLRPTIFNFTTLQLDTARANFDLLGNRLDFGELRLTGPRAAIDARGGYRLDTKALSFAAKIRPFDASDSFLGATFGAVFTPLSSVLEVKLTGTIDQPAWSFAYGPTSLFRALTGDGPKPPELPKSAQPARSP